MTMADAAEPGGMESQAFQLDKAQALCEALEGDLVIVHFESGLYYSIQGTGVGVCLHVFDGLTLGEIITRFARHYGVPDSQVRSDICNFVGRLVEEKLLMPASSVDKGEGPTESRTFAPGPYTPPTFERFDDMADQLLLDKIEDETAQPDWPAPPVP